MKKNAIIIIIVILLLFFGMLWYIMSNTSKNNLTIENTNNSDIYFPKTINVSYNNNIIGQAILNRKVWQYPEVTKNHSQITGTRSYEFIFEKLKSTLDDKNSIQYFENINVDLSDVLEVSNELFFAQLILFDSSGSRIIETTYENIKNELNIDLNSINNNGTYYCYILLEYPYSSFLEYIFKLEK